uniref:Uncharacterized protein C19orf60 homolog isoform X2 n=1 Tax=Sus scrofa TaxID=9823 RepID=A0A480I5R8_PIG
MPVPARARAHPRPHQLLSFRASRVIRSLRNRGDSRLCRGLGGDHDCAALAPPGSRLHRCARRPLEARRLLDPACGRKNLSDPGEDWEAKTASFSVLTLSKHPPLPCFRPAPAFLTFLILKCTGSL